MKKTTFLVSMFFLFLFFSGCGKSSSSPQIATITVAPSSATVLVGQTRTFSAAATDGQGQPISFTPFWSVIGNIGTIDQNGVFTAGGSAGNGKVKASSGSVSGEATVTVTSSGGHNLTNLFFLHHSTGANLISQGDVRGFISNYNSAQGTNFAFWDHGYNSDGLTNPQGESTGTNYAIPSDNTDPDGLHYLWTSSVADAVAARNQIMNNHEVIAFKSCFPASAITDDEMLQQYKNWYLDMRNFFDGHPEKLFVVISPPPLHRLATNSVDAARARTFANWLKSSEYLNGHSNVVCFDLFDYLAGSDNMLKYEYEISHGSDDSHPNESANQTIGPILAQFLIEAALNY